MQVTQAYDGCFDADIVFYIPIKFASWVTFFGDAQAYREKDIG